MPTALLSGGVTDISASYMPLVYLTDREQWLFDLAQSLKKMSATAYLKGRAASIAHRRDITPSLCHIL